MFGSSHTLDRQVKALGSRRGECGAVRKRSGHGLQDFPARAGVRRA